MLKAIQVHDSYLIAETGDGMMVIDQHALHERILYEELRSRVGAGTGRVATAAGPRAGGPDGGRGRGCWSSKARSWPSSAWRSSRSAAIRCWCGASRRCCPHVVPERLVRDLAEHFRTQPLPPTRDGLLAELLHMVACKAAVKAGQPLSPPEIAALLERRHLVADSHHCPHGRPTALVFTKADLEKQFGRI